MAEENSRTSIILEPSQKEKYLQKVSKNVFDFLPQLFPEQRSLKSILKELSNTNQIEDLVRLIFSIKFFKNFEILQICYHIKSYTQAKIISSDQNVELNMSDLSAVEFHQYLQSVKKSKNKYFQTGVDAFPHFHSLGTFLAKEFIFADISFIFIVSRNDFLRPTKEEYELFYQTSEFLKNKIKNLLVSKEFDQKQNDLVQIKSEIHKILKLGADTSSPLVQFYQSERIKLMANLLDTLKHELSNPLFGINLAVENLIEFEDKDSQEVQREIIANIKRSQNIIDNFVSLYENKDFIETFSLKDCIQEAITLSKSATSGISKEIIFENTEEMEITSNKTSLIQIIFNAIINSSQALNHHQGDEHPSIKIYILKDLINLKIQVIDNGPGIEENQNIEYFKPFYTTKDKGTGLGLSICRSLAKKINASVSLNNNSSTNGAVFEIVFPLL